MNRRSLLSSLAALFVLPWMRPPITTEVQPLVAGFWGTTTEDRHQGSGSGSDQVEMKLTYVTFISFGECGDAA